MMVPTIHNNGTSERELILQLVRAASAIDVAMAALGNAAPHGRDYYPQDKGLVESSAYGKARAEHEARVRKLIDVKNELTEIGEAIIKRNDPKG